MKKKYVAFILSFLLSACLLFSGGRVSALANSAAPIKPDDGSGIVFKQHEYVQIQSEILDIRINDDVTANITATYIMKNFSSEPLNVETMFLTPVENGENKNISVENNGEALNFNQEFYSAYSYSDNKAQSIDDWESILADARSSESEYSENQYVAAIVYYVDFEPSNNKVNLP